MKTHSRRHKYNSPAVEDKSPRQAPVRPRFSPFGHFSFFQYFMVIITVCVSIVICFWNVFRKEDNINIPLGIPKMNHEGSTLPEFNPDKFWGTYRPNVYFGLKTRSKRPLVIGLMWLEQDFEENKDQYLRHWCSENDDIVKYGWLRHDGVNFGIHEVIEKTFHFNASFVKRQGGLHGGDWTVRVSANSKDKKEAHIVSFFFYVALEDFGKLQPIRYLDSYGLLNIVGKTAELGSFRLRFPTPHPHSDFVLNYTLVDQANLDNLTDVIIQNLNESMIWEKKVFVLPHVNTKHANLIVHQITARLPIEFDILYESHSSRRPNRLQGNVFTNELNSLSDKFDKKFEAVFGISKPKYIDQDVNFAKKTLSNMLGSISYFYGTSLVKSKQSESVKKYWPATLYTTVPSRSKFPRGFLWNVGFDIFLINLWDVDMAEDIIAHWLDLMNVEGWIPREQILGSEAASHIPPQFIVQRNDIANPPSVFLGILNLIKIQPTNQTFLKKILPRLETWFNWLHSSQHGEKPNSYYWRGRNSSTKEELIPYTFASGLDDYPRASHPNTKERHLDLRCWMAMAASVLTKIAKLTDSDCERYENIQKELTDEKLLDLMHWDNKNGFYTDFGLHTDYLHLNTMTKTRKVNRAPKLRFVGAMGYVSLFPLILRILDSDSLRLRKLLLDLENEDLLWTEFGIRSLAKTSPFYNQYNAIHDPPHWRGAIWINMNYLILGSLYHYSKVPGQYQGLALDIYIKLRDNLINNVINEYNRKGYVFEQYNDVTGSGQGSFPFTGWSALIVNIMAEKYY